MFFWIRCLDGCWRLEVACKVCCAPSWRCPGATNALHRDPSAHGPWRFHILIGFFFWGSFGWTVACKKADLPAGCSFGPASFRKARSCPCWASDWWEPLFSPVVCGAKTWTLGFWWQRSWIRWCGSDGACAWLAKLKASKKALLHSLVLWLLCTPLKTGIFALGDELMVSLKDASKPGDVAQLKVRMTSKRTWMQNLWLRIAWLSQSLHSTLTHTLTSALRSSMTSHTFARRACVRSWCPAQSAGESEPCREAQTVPGALRPCFGLQWRRPASTS